MILCYLSSNTILRMRDKLINNFKINSYLKMNITVMKLRHLPQRSKKKRSKLNRWEMRWLSKESRFRSWWRSLRSRQKLSRCSCHRAASVVLRNMEWIDRALALEEEEMIARKEVIFHSRKRSLGNMHLTFKIFNNRLPTKILLLITWYQKLKLIKTTVTKV